MYNRNFIGSSDIACVLGIHPFKSILELWGEKTGNIKPKDLSDNEYVEWGIRNEPTIADKFADRNDVKLMAYKRRYVHPEYDFLSCELDRLIVGTDELLECKTASAWLYNDWKSGDIPVAYQAQVMWALGLSKRKIGHVAVLVGGNRYFQKKIEFDQKVFDVMVERAVDFWNDYVVPKVMPSVIGSQDSKVLEEIYGEQEDTDPEELPLEAEGLVESINELKSDRKVVEREIKQQQNQLKALLGKKTTGLTERHKVTWKSQGYRSIDAKRLREEKPEVYDRYLRNTKRRVLRISKRKDTK